MTKAVPLGVARVAPHEYKAMQQGLCDFGFLT